MASNLFITKRRMAYSSTHGHSKHVESVLALDGHVYSRQDVINLIDHNWAVYTYVPSTGHQARVTVRRCHACSINYLTTAADPWTDDNLDKLPQF